MLVSEHPIDHQFVKQTLCTTKPELNSCVTLMKYISINGDSITLEIKMKLKIPRYNKHELRFRLNVQNDWK